MHDLVKTEQKHTVTKIHLQVVGQQLHKVVLGF